MSLSEKFAKLKAPQSATAARAVRANDRMTSQQSSRAQQTQNKRGGPPPKTAGKPSRRPGPKGKGPMKGKNSSGGKKSGPAKEKPKTAAELDQEMASYWFKAGKGPDPKLVSLDAEMDDYFKAKPSAEATAAAAATAASKAAPGEAAASSTTAAAVENVPAKASSK